MKKGLLRRTRNDPQKFYDSPPRQCGQHHSNQTTTRRGSEEVNQISSDEWTSAGLTLLSVKVCRGRKGVEG
ncbi:hypothetical protein DPEC_G00063890 [Dallia pectoralis]|uniref:Uncharacterized protein n=1 Tax=Dallia pectoralis TaxID=75939 RepID=A0ACC2H7P3_DALPE|nr:hypothetical protein DPEC_G00063890 [Dallia pectoralis]